MTAIATPYKGHVPPKEIPLPQYNLPGVEEHIVTAEDTNVDCFTFLPPQINIGSNTLSAKDPVAVKYDEGKVDLTILPLSAQEEIAKVFMFGAKKYARGNFTLGTGLKYTRVIASLLRHTYAFMRGEDLDPESGLNHLSHAGACIYMLLHYAHNKEKYANDDRENIIP